MGHILTATDSSGTATYTYDALYRLTSAVYPGKEGSEGFDYNAVCNRLHYTKNGATLYHAFWQEPSALRTCPKNIASVCVATTPYHKKPTFFVTLQCFIRIFDRRYGLTKCHSISG